MKYGTVVKVDVVLCMSCGGCVGVCPSLALELENGVNLVLIEENCTDCGICARFCPVGAINKGKFSKGIVHGD